VHPTSVKAVAGVEALKAAMAGKASVVTGPSGVGKSSLLNAIQPGLQLRTGDVSRRIRRGRNITVSSVMIPLAGGGYLVDTPGFSEVGMWGVDPRELADCFPDFRPFLGDCRFADCRHRMEPDCRVREAVEGGAVAPDRYQSYLALLQELEAQPRDWE
jgi:ribosome biogenesis GTPase